jgi:hypothetical protein
VLAYGIKLSQDAIGCRFEAEVDESRPDVRRLIALVRSRAQHHNQVRAAMNDRGAVEIL